MNKPEVNPYDPPRVDSPSVGGQRNRHARDLKWTLFSFEGRLPRRIVWMVFPLLGGYFVSLIVVREITFAAEMPAVSSAVNLLALVSLIPGAWIYLAVLIKRWHDRNKPGAWVLIVMVPYIGGLWQFIETGFLEGTPGPNDFGPEYDSDVQTDAKRRRDELANWGE